MSETDTTSAVPSARPSDDRPVLRSPAGSMHAALGAAIALGSGWEIVRSYGEPDEERKLITESLAIADVTARAKIDVRGDLAGVEPLGAEGDVVARLSPRWAMIFAAPGDVGDRVQALQDRAGTGAMVTDATHLYSGYALCGPLLPDLLARVSGWNPASLPSGGATGAPIVDVRAVVVRRETPFPAVEVYVSSEFGRYVWETLLGVVTSLGGGPVGWDALRAEGWA